MHEYPENHCRHTKTRAALPNKGTDLVAIVVVVVVVVVVGVVVVVVVAPTQVPSFSSFL